MKTYLFCVTFLIGFILIDQNGFAQNAKKFYKIGNDYYKTGNYELAVEQFTKAIELDQKYTKAFEGRALAYEQLKNYKNAAEDFESLSELQPKDYTNALKSAGYYFKIGEYTHAKSLIETIEGIAPELPDIYNLKAKCLFALNKYNEAKDASDKAIKLSPSHENYYIRGLTDIKLNKISEAESDFKESLKLKPDFTDASVELVNILTSQNKNDEALQTINSIIEQNDKNEKAYLMRSQIYFDKANFKSSVEDATKAINLGQNQEGYFIRGNAYIKNKQYSEACNDFSQVIKLAKDNLKAIEKRAMCYQQMNKKVEAINDYEMILSLAKSSKEGKEILENAKTNLFELKRENNRPNICLLGSQNMEIKTIEAPEGLDDIYIKLRVQDESEISKLTAANVLIPFNQDSIKVGQLIKLNIQNQTTVEIVAEDIYQNKTSISYKIIRRDEGLPKIAVSYPYVSESGVAYIKSFDPEIVVEGKILAKNLIDSIRINNIPAVFDNSTKNPIFRLKININDAQKLTFTVKDNKGHLVQKNLPIDRSDAMLLNDNPMGRTWVVFVENSDYKSFSNLEGPKKQIDLMIKALAKYKIDKIIHKRNLTKSQMESFFNYELKNLVIENRVNSLLIWYAGHGKLLGQNGFWIPVDSKIDDVSTYFNINTLKSSIKPYIQNITHSLIVTDACETGPSFYMSMRDIMTERNCGDNKSTKFKSSQVFTTSSGNDLSDGDSQFTSSFANSLMFDNNSCVPIERIVSKVTDAVSKSNKSKPKFGKITGFEDENGTFIFIKK